MDLEWYSEKERINVEKHGIDLETVKQVFDDPFRIEKYDESHSGAENRWQVLGKSGDVLFVVYGAGNQDPHHNCQGGGAGGAADLLWRRRQKKLVYPLSG
jgi:uncharacterized DUF497 family protein